MKKLLKYELIWRYVLIVTISMSLVLVAAGVSVVATVATIIAYEQFHEVPPADAVVYVDTGKGHGSGVHVGKGLILTAAHVVAGAEKVTIRDKAGTESDTEVLWSAKDYDIALIRITDADAIDKIPAAKISCDTLSVGDEIRSVGNPLNMEFVSGYGKVVGTPRKVGTVKSVYITEITTIMGQSGGPIFHDGKIAAIVSMVMVAPMKMGEGYVPSLTGYGYAVPSSVVCDLMGRTS